MQIAKMNAMLVATADQFTATFSKAAKDVKGFAGTVAGVASGMAVLEIAKGFASAAYDGTVGLVKQQMEAVDANAKLSDRLGVTTESLAGLQHAAGLAGVSSEQLTGGMEKMLKTLGDAAIDGGDAAKALNEIGLDPKALANMSSDKSISAIADALSKIKNPAEQARTAVEIFGKSGQSLLPLLQGGAAGISQMQKEAELLGLTMSRTDAAKVEAANDAITKVGEVVQGVGNKLAVELAPYIELVANKLVEFATAGGGIGPKVGGAVEWVIKMIAKASDVINGDIAILYMFEAAALKATESAVWGFGKIIQGVEWLNQKLTGDSSHFGDAFVAAADNLGKKADAAFLKAGQSWDDYMKGTNQKAVLGWFDQVKASATSAAEAVAASKSSVRDVSEAAVAGAKKVAEQIATLQKQVDQFNKSKAEKASDDVFAAGGNAAQAAQASALQTELDGLEAQKKAHEDAAQAAKKYYEETRTPAEKYAAEIEHINELLMAGDLDSETAQRAADKAAADLKKEQDGSGDKDKTTGPKLLQAGSQDAAQFIAQIQRQQQDPASEQKQMVKGQLTGNKFLEQIAKNTQPGPVETVMEFA